MALPRCTKACIYGGDDFDEAVRCVLASGHEGPHEATYGDERIYWVTFPGHARPEAASSPFKGGPMAKAKKTAKKPAAKKTSTKRTAKPAGRVGSKKPTKKSKKV